MGNGKAVTIGTGVGNNDKTYFFGNAASTKGMTFSYVEGAYYLGKEAKIEDSVDKDVSLLTNYYVGNDTATDTLKIVGVDTKTGKTLNPVKAKISL